MYGLGSQAGSHEASSTDSKSCRDRHGFGHQSTLGLYARGEVGHTVVCRGSQTDPVSVQDPCIASLTDSWQLLL